MVEKLGSEDGVATAAPTRWPRGEDIQPDPVLVQIDYEADEITLQAVADKHRISLHKLRRMADKLGWRRRYKRPVDRGLLISGMLRLVAHSIAQLEANLGTLTDKEAALLGSLARTLDKLIALDDAEKGRSANDSKAGNLADLRDQLARRIEGLKRR